LKEKLSGGALLAAISTSIVALVRNHYGRGPMKAKTYVLDDIIVCVMRGSGFTAIEQTMMDSGKRDAVESLRDDFQRVMANRYTAAIEELTARKVVAFLSEATVDPDVMVQLFFLDEPLAGLGATDVASPPGG
jgi:uncharacterized protein YbcI